MFAVKSNFNPSENALLILRKGGILSPLETPREMVERVVEGLLEPEQFFSTKKSVVEDLKRRLLTYLDNKYCVMSTPIMTNAGKHKGRSLSACAVPSVNFTGNWQKNVQKIIDKFHEDGMGTGFNLNECEDPEKVLLSLNEIAINGSLSGREDRPVGNMAILSIHHPKIRSFVDAKAKTDLNKQPWKFNISIDTTEDFISALKRKKEYTLFDGSRIDETEVMEKIVSATYLCGDPGLVFLDRMNQHNPIPSVGKYTSTAPCGEVGLAPDEVCQFGYINIGKFAQPNKSNFPIDLERLIDLISLLTRVLDNAIEVNIKNSYNKKGSDAIKAKRKIGIGICGLADLFIALKIPYDSIEARKLAQEIVGFISYHSKKESHKLALTRGSFKAISEPDCRYISGSGYLTERYGDLDTKLVSKKEWRELNRLIFETKMLRNATTIALPPTGRSALVIDASCGIEPLFSLENNILGDLSGQNSVLKTALQIKPMDHLMMAALLQSVVDEAISKTINLPNDAKPKDIYNLYLKAYSLNLKGITIYRDGCRSGQPKKLDQPKNIPSKKYYAPASKR